MTKSSLVDQLAKVERKVAGRGLRMDEILAVLDGEEKEAVLAALRDHDRVSHRALAEILTANGHQIEYGAIGKWRTREKRRQAAE